MKKYGKWQKGEIRFMSADEMRKSFKEAGLGVKKPTAIEEQRALKRWRIYHKPLTPDEFWD